VGRLGGTGPALAAGPGFDRMVAATPGRWLPGLRPPSRFPAVTVTVGGRAHRNALAGPRPGSFHGGNLTLPRSALNSKIVTVRGRMVALIEADSEIRRSESRVIPAARADVSPGTVARSRPGPELAPGVGPGPADRASY
jgi:hypothetical protein